jgi:hypothetical protein
LVGGLSEMRILMLTSWERSIRRIGSLQSSISDPVDEAVGDAEMVGDEQLRLGSDNQEALDRGGSSKHHRLGVFWISFPTMLSPSSFPLTSNKMSEGRARKGIQEWDKPLKIMASFGTQTLPKVRFSLAVSRNTRPVRCGLSVKTLILSC